MISRELAVYIYDISFTEEGTPFYNLIYIYVYMYIHTHPCRKIYLLVN